MHHANENTTNYQVRFRDSHNVNEECNVIPITKGVQEHGMNILYLPHVTSFDALQQNDKKEAEI